MPKARREAANRLQTDLLGDFISSIMICSNSYDFVAGMDTGLRLSKWALQSATERNKSVVTAGFVVSILGWAKMGREYKGF